MTKKSEKFEITNAALIRMGRGLDQRPSLVYDGDAVEIGSAISAKLENGVTYTGSVSDVISADGNHVIEFAGGLTPLK